MISADLQFSPAASEAGAYLPPGSWRRLAEAYELTLLDQMLLRDLYQYAGEGRDWPLAVTLAALLQATRQGHLCLDLSLERLSAAPEATPEPLELSSWALKFMAGVRRERYGQLVARKDPNLYRPLVWVARPEGPLLYFHKYYFHSRRLQQRLLAYLAVSPRPDNGDQDHPALLADLYQDERVLRVGRNLHPIARDKAQLEALAIALGRQFTLISGGPGTGKTSLMVNLLRALVRQGSDPEAIVLGAPTGRAAQRMTEAVGTLLDSIQRPAPEDRALGGITAQTLHSLLRYRPHSHEFYYHRRRPLSAQVVVLDETSMVDVVLMDQFLQALDPARTRLVMLGDKDQLPAVEAGAVFSEMIPRAGEPGIFEGHLATLTTVFRSGVRLAALARAVNQGTWPADPPLSFAAGLELGRDRWGWVAAHSAEDWRRCQERWTRRWYQEHEDSAGQTYPLLIQAALGRPSADLITRPGGRKVLSRLFDLLEEVRILTLVRKGPYGCEAINHRMVLRMAEVTRRHPSQTRGGLISGVPVLITRNDPRRGLYNGDVGLCLEDSKGQRQVYFRRGAEFSAWPDAMLPPFEPAFAMTVHKSQGSEYGRVLLVLPDDPAQRLLSREILYTGITRAKQSVLVYGPRACLEAALTRRIARISGLQWEASDAL